MRTGYITLKIVGTFYDGKTTLVCNQKTFHISIKLSS